LSDIPVEEEHLDVLQNIEVAIQNTYVQHPELTDYEVDRSLEALAKAYKLEASGRMPVLPNSPMSRLVYEVVREACEIRLGRAPIPKNLKILGRGRVEPVSVEVIIKCLRRLCKSIDFWTKKSGRQGYLNYISQFMH
jgi:hypothetical protein